MVSKKNILFIKKEKPMSPKIKNIIDIEFELSDVCNANCPLCARNYKNIKIENKFRPINEIIYQLDYLLKDNNIKWIRLVGALSEPTLYPDFFKLIKEIKYRCINIEICTNGDTHDTTWWYELSTLLTQNDKVYFTICGSTQEIHEVYRKNTKLENILNNIKSFQLGGLNIDYAQCIQFNYNQKDLNSERFLNKIDFISNLYMTETYLKMDPNNYNSDIVKTDILDPIPNKDYKKLDSITKNFKKNKVKINCKAKEQNSIFISKDGEIYPCYLFYEQSLLNNPNIDKNWDYKKIERFEYPWCRFCEKSTRKILQKKDMEYII